MTQHDQIVEYLIHNDELSPMTAFSELNITKLATRVSEMIRLGVPIEKHMVRKTVERDGKKRTVSYMTYSLGVTAHS